MNASVFERLVIGTVLPLTGMISTLIVSRCTEEIDSSINEPVIEEAKECFDLRKENACRGV